MRVHRNLNKKCWSLTVKGEKVRHVDSFALADVTFVVSAATRARVLREQVRAVHAWAQGEACEAPASLEGMVKVTYNPYRCGSFTRADNGEPVEGAALAVFAADGSCWVRERLILVPLTEGSSHGVS